MALDSDIVEIIENVIKNDLTAPRVPKKRVPKLKHAWKCQSAHFFYGHRVGYYKGLAEGMILAPIPLQLPTEEDNGVFEIVKLTSKSSGHTLHITKTDIEESPHREYMLIIFYVITNTGDKKLN